MKNLKLYSTFIMLISIVFVANAQLVQKIGTNPTVINPSAVLELESTTKGFLPPRVALTGTNDVATILAPATSLQVYNTATAGTTPNNVVPGYYYYNGAKWVASSGDGSNNWSLTGNAGTTPATNFIGTKDAQDLVLKTNNVEKMRVTSASRVGIGTTNPAYSLEVVEEGLSRGIVNSNYSNGGATYGGYLGMRSARGTKTLPTALQSGDALGYLGFTSYLATGFNPTNNPSGMSCVATQNHTNAAGGTKLQFFTIANNTTAGQMRMAIYDTGTVAVIGNFEVGGAANITGDITTPANIVANWISAVGMTSASYNYYSDIRLKRNIKNIDNALTTVAALRPVSYEKKQSIDATEYTMKETGFIAQELQKVLPDLVHEGVDKDKTLSVNYTAIIPVLTKAIQEQQLMIEKQQAQIEELKALIMAKK